MDTRMCGAVWALFGYGHWRQELQGAQVHIMHDAGKHMKTLHMHHYPACFGFSDAMSPATTALEVSTCKLLTTSNTHIRSHTLNWLVFIRCMFIFLALQHPTTGNLNFIWCVMGSKRLATAQDSETTPLMSCSSNIDHVE